MSKLSPAAKAVLTAVTLTKYDIPPEGLPAFAEEIAPLLAVALRVAADQMSSHHSKSFLYSIADVLTLQTIATELEAQ